MIYSKPCFVFLPYPIAELCILEAAFYVLVLFCSNVACDIDFAYFDLFQPLRQNRGIVQIQCDLINTAYLTQFCRDFATHVDCQFCAKMRIIIGAIDTNLISEVLLDIFLTVSTANNPSCLWNVSVR